MENLDVMKKSADNFGFDPSWVSQVLQKYGQQVLTLVNEAARSGFSVSLIVEILQKYGPAILQFLLVVLNHQQALNRLKNAGNVIEGTDVTPPIDTSLLDIIIQKYLPIIIENYLPNVWSQYGPMIMQFINSNLQNILDNFGPQIIQFLQNNLQNIFEQFGPQILQMVLQLLLTNVQTGKSK